MGKSPKPIEIMLTQEEAALLRSPTGDGGQQGFHKVILDRLNDDTCTLAFTDEELGKLIRYTTQYGPGGFQSRLRKAFRRPLRELFSASS